MNCIPNQDFSAATLVGGGHWHASELAIALARAPQLFAADGGANRLLRAGKMPQKVIGDLDSLAPETIALLGPDRLHRIPEQLTTDFDKALRSIQAPLVLGLGFLGGRIDHTLAALHTLIRHAERPCILIGPKDITFAAPARPLTFDLRKKDRLSLFPMAHICGTSHGLRWPIEGLTFAPDRFIGTSNEVSAPKVQLDFQQIGMLITLPRGRLDAAISALCAP